MVANYPLLLRKALKNRLALLGEKWWNQPVWWWLVCQRNHALMDGVAVIGIDAGNIDCWIADSAEAGIIPG